MSFIKVLQLKQTAVSPYWVRCWGNLTITIGTLQCCNRLQPCVQLPSINKTPLPMHFHYYFISFCIPLWLPPHFHRRTFRLSGVWGNKAHWVKHIYILTSENFPTIPSFDHHAPGQETLCRKSNPRTWITAEFLQLIRNTYMRLAEGGCWRAPIGWTPAHANSCCQKFMFRGTLGTPFGSVGFIVQAWLSKSSTAASGHDMFIGRIDAAGFVYISSNAITWPVVLLVL